jgi:hypothetical protein
MVMVWVMVWFEPTLAEWVKAMLVGINGIATPHFGQLYTFSFVLPTATSVVFVKVILAPQIRHWTVKEYAAAIVHYSFLFIIREHYKIMYRWVQKHVPIHTRLDYFLVTSVSQGESLNHASTTPVDAVSPTEHCRKRAPIVPAGTPMLTC